MGELAERIDAHLKRFESDPEINIDRSGNGLMTYYGARAGYGGGPKLSVTYVTYQDRSKLSKAEAEKYLAWLDAGNVGRHYEALS